MATDRKTGMRVETYKHNSTISYDATQPGGSVHALKGFAMKAVAAGAGLVQAGEAILGELLTVSRDGYCSVAVEGQGLNFIQGAANGVSPGNKLVGAIGDSVGGQTGGYVANTGSDVDGRFYATKVASSAKNAKVTANS